jgi:flagellar protein FliT
MTEDDHILAIYEAVLRVTSKMLEAARKTDWDKLIALESECRVLIEELISRNGAHKLSREQLARKAVIIRKVLADDAEIRNLTEAGMARLQWMLGGAVQQRKLREAYETDRGY